MVKKIVKKLQVTYVGVTPNDNRVESAPLQTLGKGTWAEVNKTYSKENDV